MVARRRSTSWAGRVDSSDNPAFTLRAKGVGQPIAVLIDSQERIRQSAGLEKAIMLASWAYIILLIRGLDPVYFTGSLACKAHLRDPVFLIESFIPAKSSMPVARTRLCL